MDTQIDKEAKMKSDSDLTDEGRKRKNIEDIEALMTKSKKTMRTPTKKVSYPEDKLDKMMNVLMSLSADIQEIKQEQKQYKEEIAEIKGAYNKIEKENERLINENKQIKKELYEIKHVTEYIEKEKRKCNVIISGIKDKETEGTSIVNQISELFQKRLQIEVQITKAFKVGKNTSLVQLKNMEEKETVMKNKHKLRKLNEETKIYINDDLTTMERKKQAEIRRLAKEMLNKGHRAKIGYNKITIDDKEWRWDKIKSKLVPPKN